MGYLNIDKGERYIDLLNYFFGFCVCLKRFIIKSQGEKGYGF